MSSRSRNQRYYAKHREEIKAKVRARYHANWLLNKDKTVERNRKNYHKKIDQYRKQHQVRARRFFHKHHSRLLKENLLRYYKEWIQNLQKSREAYHRYHSNERWRERHSLVRHKYYREVLKLRHLMHSTTNSATKSINHLVNRDYILLRQRIYNLSNREYANQRMRIWREHNKEHLRIYRELHPNMEYYEALNKHQINLRRSIARHKKNKKEEVGALNVINGSDAEVYKASEPEVDMSARIMQLVEEQDEEADIKKEEAIEEDSEE